MIMDLKSTILLLVATIFTKLQFQVSVAADSNSYIGAVAEYHPIINGTNGTTISKENAKNYVTIIKYAKRYNADIVVFPEDSLTAGLNHSDTDRSQYPFYSSFIPEPGTDLPCDNSSSVVIEALRLISCAAKDNSIYVVANLHEMVNCTSSKELFNKNCSKDNYLFYNTNVVFNRTGVIISKYRKYNLFSEPGINVTSVAENATFITDFNVKFGHIICFDIYFKTPALNLIRNYNVTDFIHPSRWFSEIPYLTTIQTQSSWSYANDVNLLSSGYNMPKTTNRGSGIYAGNKGKLVTLWTENMTNSILIAKIPKFINGRRSIIESDNNYPIIYSFTHEEVPTFIKKNLSTPDTILFQDNFKPYNTKLLPHNNGRTLISLELCDRGLCCNFIIDRKFEILESVTSDFVYYRHRIAVFNGVRSFAGSVTAGIQICSIISCTNDTLSSCGLRFTNDQIVKSTLFNGISISGYFSNRYPDTIQMPNSLISGIMLPLNSEDFVFKIKNFNDSSLNNIEYNLTRPVNDLISFSIYGRDFSKDGKNSTDHSSISFTPFLPFILFITTAATVFNLK